MTPASDPERLARNAERRATLESRRAISYPISRWYLRPVAGWVALILAPTTLRPVNVTIAGFLLAAVAGLLLWFWPMSTWSAALLILGAWFCDRLDGQLARRQGTVTRWGGWLDANLDELADLGLHMAVAQAATIRTESAWNWTFLTAFLFGKYLLMHGLLTTPAKKSRRAAREPKPIPAESSGLYWNWLRQCYHFPGNADVRVHLLVAALALGAFSGWCLTVELAFIAVYYNLRWPLRYFLLRRRLRGK